MSDDLRSFANWDPSVRSDPAQATEVNQSMYTQTQLTGYTYGGDQLATGGRLGAPYGQNPEHQSLHQTSAPMPTQGFLAPTYPTHAYPSSTYPAQSFSPLPASGGHQRHAPVGALNHNGDFGASNVGASNIHHGHAGHLFPPSSHAVMPPSSTPTPPMTAGTSRSSSYTTETHGSVDGWVPPTVEDFRSMITKIMLPQLTSGQKACFWLRFKAGNPPLFEELSAMIAANKANEASSSAHHAGLAPPRQPTPAYGPSMDGPSRSHANGTTGAYRTPKTCQPRHDPRSATTTTYQAAATSADLANNNSKSTGATLRGGSRSSGAGRVASSRTRSTMKPTGTPASKGGIALPKDSPRNGKGSWATTLLHTAEEHTILDIMCSQPSKTCLWPECGQGECSSVQRRDTHVFRIHTGTEKKELCGWPGCDSVLADDSRRRHMLAHAKKAAAEQAAAVE